jgi:hypothetical protein
MSRRALVTLMVVWTAAAGAAFTACLADPHLVAYAPWIVILAIIELPTMWALGRARATTPLRKEAATLFLTLATVIGYISTLFDLARLLTGLEGQHGLEAFLPAGFLSLGAGAALAIVFARTVLARRHPEGARRVLAILVGISLAGVLAALIVPLTADADRLSLIASSFAGLWAAPLLLATRREPSIPEARVNRDGLNV